MSWWVSWIVIVRSLILWLHPGSSRIILDHPWSSRIILDHPGSSRIIQDVFLFYELVSVSYRRVIDILASSRKTLSQCKQSGSYRPNWLPSHNQVYWIFFQTTWENFLYPQTAWQGANPGKIRLAKISRFGGFWFLWWREDSRFWGLKSRALWHRHKSKGPMTKFFQLKRRDGLYVGNIKERISSHTRHLSTWKCPAAIFLKTGPRFSRFSSLFSETRFIIQLGSRLHICNTIGRLMFLMGGISCLWDLQHMQS